MGLCFDNSVIPKFCHTIAITSATEFENVHECKQLYNGPVIGSITRARVVSSYIVLSFSPATASRQNQSAPQLSSEKQHASVGGFEPCRCDVEVGERFARVGDVTDANNFRTQEAAM